MVLESVSSAWQTVPSCFRCAKARTSGLEKLQGSIGHTSSGRFGEGFLMRVAA